MAWQIAYRQTFLSLIFLASVTTVFYAQFGDLYSGSLAINRNYLSSQSLEGDKDLHLALSVQSKTVDDFDGIMLSRRRLPRAAARKKNVTISPVQLGSSTRKSNHKLSLEGAVKNHLLEHFKNTQRRPKKTLSTKPGMVADYCNFPENMKPGDEGTVLLNIVCWQKTIIFVP